MGAGCLWVGILCASVGVPSAHAEDRAQEPVRIGIFREPDLSVELVLQPRASLADEDWLALEFENLGSSPLPIQFITYRIGSPSFASGAESTPGLRGGMRELFPDQWPDFPRLSIALAPKQRHRAAAALSDPVSAALGHAPADGEAVELQVFVLLGLPGDRTLSTPDRGVTAALQWLPLSAAGVERVRPRLAAGLLTPREDPRHAAWLAALLAVPELAVEFSPSVLLAALDRRSTFLDGRGVLVEHLARALPGDPTVREHYLRALEQGDPRVFEEATLDGIWHPELLDPLVRAYERNPQAHTAALSALHHRRTAWHSDPALVARVVAAFRAGARFVPRPSTELVSPELPEWAREVARWALTADPELPHWLATSLSDLRHLRKIHGWNSASNERLDPLRACDAALEAILTHLDGTPDGVYEAAGELELRDAWIFDREEQYIALRDRLIVNLRRRLTELGPR